MREQVQEVFNRLADEDPGPPGRRRKVRRREGGRTRMVVLASVILGLLIAPFGIAATGDVLREGVRNGTTASETEIIGKFNATSGAKGGYVTRQSNTQTGANAGGGAIYGCRGAAGGTAGGSAPCLRASNLADGLAFEFSSNSGPAGLFEVASAGDAPFVTNGGGLVTNLNADKVDGLDAAQLKGATGAAGPKGDTGDPGPTGPQGPAGPSGGPAIRAVLTPGTAVSLSPLACYAIYTGGAAATSDRGDLLTGWLENTSGDAVVPNFVIVIPGARNLSTQGGAVGSVLLCNLQEQAIDLPTGWQVKTSTIDAP